MSGHVEINALDVAQAILADPRKRYTVSTLQILALCQCVVAFASELEQLGDAAPAEVPTTNARLAAAIAALIDKEEAVRTVDLRDDAAICAAVQTRDEAINTLKTVFEEEFPHVPSV